MPNPPANPDDPTGDPLLRDVPTRRGMKVLGPAVLYARIGAGGMGAVYRGWHLKLDIDVAVKCLKPSLAADSPTFVARFEREARLAARLAHQNVVRVMDVESRHGLHYLVMEFVTGETARDRVRRKGRLDEQEALAILLGAVTGLAEAHQRGIVHRDIKPDNVLVSAEGRVKLADLGLAKGSQTGGDSISLHSGVMGTPQYMPPEQWNSADVGPTADVWALGATLYYLLVGEHAIELQGFADMALQARADEFPSLRAARPGLRDEVYELFLRCVARAPEQRFADARALLAELRPLVRIEEHELADPVQADRGAAAVVSPPPRETLLTIRAELDRDAAADRDGATVPEVGGTMPMAPPGDGEPRDRGEPRAAVAVRRGPGRWLLAIAALVLIAAGGGWLAGWFEPAVDWDDVVAKQRASRLYWEARKLLPQPDGLDPAIDKLEQCLQLHPEHELAATPLALALDKRAERLADSDLDEAYVASSRAVALDGDERAYQERRDRLRERLRARLFAGLSITAPAGCFLHRSRLLVVPGADVPFRGEVTSAGFDELQVLLPGAAASDGTSSAGVGAWRKVPVVAGEFTFDAQLPGPGDWPVRLAMTDRHGVSGSVQRTVRVPGVVGARQPGAGSGPAPDVVVFHGAGGRMVAIAAGTFRMGSMTLALHRRADETPREVTLTRDFWMADTEVTRAQWRRVMGSEPWLQATSTPADDLPATHVRQSDAIEFCRRLTELDDAAGRLPEGYAYRLPTEAEWEYACRAGGMTAFAAGITWKDVGDYAVFGQAQPAPVGLRKANAFGLYDVHGNVAEWCLDRAQPGSDDTIVTAWLSTTEPMSILGPLGVHRGGSFRSKAEGCRCAARFGAPADQRTDSIGFRPVLAMRR